MSVSDPYRWLEAQNEPEVKEWVDAQNALAKPLLSELPSHERYTERLTALGDYESTLRLSWSTLGYFIPTIMGYKISM